MASVFECNPIHKVWDRRIPGSCFDLGASWYAYAAFNTICDLIIIIMPMPAIWRLQLKWTQKVSLAAVFLLGWFVVFTSIMRIVSLGASAKSKEPTCMHPLFVLIYPIANVSKRGLRQRHHLGRNRRRHRHHLRLPPRPARPSRAVIPPLYRQIQQRHVQPKPDIQRVPRNR